MLNIDDRLIREVQPKIGPNAMAVLLAIAIHLNQKTNRCFPSHARLMSLTGMGKNPVYDALKVLKAEGILISEQAIDSANKKFGPRVFRLTTRFIKIFVDVEDMEPLPESREPESREPESREPESREPETWETKQINNKEQINYLEQINNSERVVVVENAQAREEIKIVKSIEPIDEAFEAEKKENPSPVPAAPSPWAGFIDNTAAIAAMRTDDFMKEAFTRVNKIPAEQFATYCDDFATLVQSEGRNYNSAGDMRKHFNNWSRRRFEEIKKKQAAPGPGNAGSNTRRAVNDFGGDPEKYKTPMTW